MNSDSKNGVYRGGKLVEGMAIYSVDKRAFLGIKLDIQQGVYENNGPGLWGDLEDDEDSFNPVGDN